ncbi:MAG: bifunctional 2-polyprenyl-6-hydroxyphenol methylase/3-demethylubiquinol 3-O-methyltransferase UbiG [Candidatus Latescibacterota bacterium]|jgi:2-polyprenyl-6-hydroxyphenyl methylase/3-demethylubiquinone-9 3-methyltransferase
MTLPTDRIRDASRDAVPRATYNRIDNGLYDAQSDLWWQPDSAFHQLKAFLNPARVGYAQRKLFDNLHLDPRGKRALEVGCGGGLLCEEIARMGFETTGIDPSARSLEVAARHAQANGLAIRYAGATGESLPSPAATYDAVFCCDVLEHVRDLPQVIAEIARVMKPGGVFYYDTFNRTWVSKLVAIKLAQEWQRWAFLPPNLHVWDMFIRPWEMKSLLRQNGLEWKEHRGMKPSVPLPRALGYLRRRARGELSYAELGKRVHLVESRITAVMFMGYATKQTRPISPTEARNG